MNRANNVLTCTMIDHAVRELGIKATIALALIGAEKAYVFRDRLTNEAAENLGARVRDDASDDIALATDGASDNGFTDVATATASWAACTGTATALVLVPVLRL